MHRRRTPRLANPGYVGSRVAAIPRHWQAAPERPEPYDVEKDEKLIANLRSDYRETLGNINQRKSGMSTNNGIQYKRRELAKLMKRLATDNSLTEDQVKRMIGLK